MPNRRSKPASSRTGGPLNTNQKISSPTGKVQLSRACGANVGVPILIRWLGFSTRLDAVPGMFKDKRT